MMLKINSRWLTLGDYYLYSEVLLSLSNIDSLIPTSSELL